MSKRYKKHNIEDRIKYIKMIEEGYSIDYICNRYGFDHHSICPMAQISKRRAIRSNEEA